MRTVHILPASSASSFIDVRVADSLKSRFLHLLRLGLYKKQAGAEMGKAQLKLKLGFTLTKI